MTFFFQNLTLRHSPCILSHSSSPNLFARSRQRHSPSMLGFNLKPQPTKFLSIQRDKQLLLHWVPICTTRSYSSQFNSPFTSSYREFSNCSLNDTVNTEQGKLNSFAYSPSSSLTTCDVTVNIQYNGFWKMCLFVNYRMQFLEYYIL